jgi:hypothetical protein
MGRRRNCGGAEPEVREIRCPPGALLHASPRKQGREKSQFSRIKIMPPNQKAGQNRDAGSSDFALEDAIR